ncbi:MAG: DUF309 domain-containing protein [Planctomycetota bacterium]
MDYDPRFLAGVDSFNRGAYFDSHDRWEELWIADGRPGFGFAKALVQAAVAMHHLSRGNFVGTEKLLNSCRQAMAPFAPQHQGMEIEVFLQDLQRAYQQSKSAGAMSAEYAPKIELKPSPSAGDGETGAARDPQAVRE